MAARSSTTAGGLPLIDSRRVEQFVLATIKGAHSLPHVELPARIDELDPSRPTILSCNGPHAPPPRPPSPHCSRADHPAEAILCYRGGLHDWITLGLPTIPGERHEQR